MKVIDIIKKEKREEKEILEALDARAKRLAEMTPEEKQALDNSIVDESAKSWDFLKD